MRLIEHVLAFMIRTILRFVRYVLMTAIVAAYTLPLFAAIVSIIAILTKSSTVMLQPTTIFFAKTVGLTQVMNGVFIILTIIAIMKSVRNTPTPQIDSRTYWVLSGMIAVSAAVFISLSRDSSDIFPFFAAFIFGSISYWTYAGTTFLQNKLLDS